jgi:hypothetical protein
MLEQLTQLESVNRKRPKENFTAIFVTVGLLLAFTCLTIAFGKEETMERVLIYNAVFYVLIFFL